MDAVMMKRLLGALGLRTARASGLAEQVAYCGALAESFADRLPPHHHNNLAITAAWWSVALYVQLAARPGRRLADRNDSLIIERKASAQSK